MTVKLWDQEGRTATIAIASWDEMLALFERLLEKEPLYCELVQSESKLSVCIRKDCGSIQHGPTNNEPPYMMAVTADDHDADQEVDFFIGNEATPISARYALPLPAVKQIIGYFMTKGERDPSVCWDTI